MEAAILAVLLDLIKGCLEADRDRLERMRARPSPLLKTLFRSKLRRQLGISPSEWRRHAHRYEPEIKRIVDNADLGEIQTQAKNAAQP